MTLKIIIRLCLLSSIVALSVSACTPRPCKVPPVNRLQACLELRRQLIFLGSNDPTTSQFQYTAGHWNSPTRQALLLKKYRDAHCDEVLRECSPPAVYTSGVTPPHPCP